MEILKNSKHMANLHSGKPPLKYYYVLLIHKYYKQFFLLLHQEIDTTASHFQLHLHFSSHPQRIWFQGRPIVVAQTK